MTTVLAGSAEVLPDDQPARRPYKYVWLFLLLSGIALAVSGWIGEALTFTGAKFFLYIVEDHALYQPFGRYSTAPFQWPTIFASSFTSDVAVLRHLFGLGYAVAPFLALLVSWVIVRRRAPGLMVWPAIGIIFVCFPGLLSTSLESPIVAEWAWPLILLTLVALDGGWTLLAAVVISAFLFFCSANSLGVFVVVAGIAIIRAFREQTLKTTLMVWAGIMIVAAVLERLVRHRDFTAPIAGHKISLGLIESELSKGEFGPLLAAYLLALCACAVMLYLRFSTGPRNRLTEFIPAGLIALAGVCLVLYSASQRSWLSASNPKDIVILLELPLFAAAVVDHLLVWKSKGRKSREPDEAAARNPILLVSGIVILLSLIIWSISWSSLMTYVTQRTRTAGSFCIPDSLVSKRHTALDSPYLPELVIDLQTRTPAHIAIDAAGCKLLHERGILRFPAGSTFRVEKGWFHFQTVASTASPSGDASGAAPGISSFSPTSGSPGTVLVIKGSHLLGTTTVTVSGLPTQILKVYEGEIRVTVPSGARSGDLVITTPEGDVTSSGAFTMS
jgi:hypothetical protein